MNNILQFYNKINITNENNKISDKLVQEIYQKSFSGVIKIIPKFNTNDKLNNVINNLIKTSLNNLNNSITKDMKSCSYKNTNDCWIYCDQYCKKFITKLINIEIHSTIYMLNVISNSLLSINDSYIIFIIKDRNIERLTGIWNHDCIYIKFKVSNSESNTRLIMGFGPSSSGKTYCSKSIIRILSATDKKFPKSFLSIDGGIYREKSLIYQKIIKDINKRLYIGLKNLFLAGGIYDYFTRKSLFEADIVKKNITKYLIDYKIKISLYIPETLGGCIFDCYNKYKKYIDITGDKKWIGLLIWQHKKHKHCDYADKYKCKGCTESGKSREKLEGKMYSNFSWEISMRNGMNEMMKAPGGRYKIHNCGGYQKDCISIIEDYTDKNISNRITSETINEKQFKLHII